nr:MAG TPA: hypothetical protein [Caudoviricetes sp.]
MLFYFSTISPIYCILSKSISIPLHYIFINIWRIRRTIRAIFCTITI